MNATPMFHHTPEVTITKLLARIDSNDDERRDRLKPLTRFATPNGTTKSAQKFWPLSRL